MISWDVANDLFRLVRRYVDVGKCLLLVDMDILYLSHLFLWELMKAHKKCVRSKTLDGKGCANTLL